MFDYCCLTVTATTKYQEYDDTEEINGDLNTPEIMKEKQIKGNENTSKKQKKNDAWLLLSEFNDKVEINGDLNTSKIIQKK